MVNKHTKNMMAMLPQWMKMAKDPSSVGAKFLDAFSFEMSEVEHYIEETWNNMYIGTANLQRADFCYKIPLALRDVVDVENLDFHVRLVIEGERIDCLPSERLQQFFETDENTYMIDTIEGYVYIRVQERFMEENIIHPFDAIEVGDALHYEYMLHAIWNVFDEFGMLLGLSRLPGERNEAFKNRILDVFKNPGGANKQGLQNGISRELGLVPYEITIGALADNEYVQESLMHADGTPTQKYMDYVEQINSNLGFAWDSMNWGEAYWRSVSENNMGFSYLPHIWDGFSPKWNDSDIQSGIGDGDDLLVIAPKEESSTRKFKAYIGLQGKEEVSEENNPEIRFKYKIRATGKVPNEEYPMESYKYTVVASEIIKLHYSIVAFRRFEFLTRIDFTSTSESTYAKQWLDNNKPGMLMVTGEDVLHTETDRYIRLHVEMKLTSNDRTVTPALQELIVDWIDSSNVNRSYTLTTDEDFTQSNTIATTTFLDTEPVSGSITLGKGSFSAVVDTEGSFLKKGDVSKTIKINKTGSISLAIPKKI